ncbi:MAG: hypothetical protein BroJett007_29810 [Chloroflexota bacterium]|nr:MAG: hypothetical protein BroJett007_29810 [Chloroflexota bacterium]
MRPIGVIIGLVLVAAVLVIVVLTTVLVPEELNPAFDVALAFTDAVLEARDDAAARALIGPELAAWVDAHCADGLSACVFDYFPDSWGSPVDTVYRRSIPDGSDAWDIQLITTFDAKLSQGFSGVCIYQRAEKAGDGTWQITRWSGWVSCGDSDAGLEQLRSAQDAPNRAP